MTTSGDEPESGADDEWAYALSAEDYYAASLEEGDDGLPHPSRVCTRCRVSSASVHSQYCEACGDDLRASMTPHELERDGFPGMALTKACETCGELAQVWAHRRTSAGAYLHLIPAFCSRCTSRYPSRSGELGARQYLVPAACVECGAGMEFWNAHPTSPDNIVCTACSERHGQRELLKAEIKAELKQERRGLRRLFG